MRLGSLGGSTISSAVAKGEGKQRKSLMYALVGELLAGQKRETFKTQPMLDGLAYEEEARQLYSLITDNVVEQIAMFKYDPYRHYSPDGVIGDDGLLELKTVIPSTWVEYKITGSIPTDYRRQMQYGLFISGRLWCDYAVYCPAIKEVLPLIIRRLVRDEKEIAELDEGSKSFIGEMLEMLDRVKK